MRSRRLVVSLIVLLWAASALAWSSDRPNFTGVWKLDTNRSKLPAQFPENVVLYIHQNDPDFHLRRTQVQHGKSTAWSVHGRTDGQTLEMKSREGVKRTHMYWQGNQLVLEIHHDDRRGHSQFKVGYTLSDDGHTLIAQDLEPGQDLKWVFTRKG